MVQEAKILEHDADAPAHLGDVAPGQAADVASEQAHQPAPGLQRQIHDPQQRGFAGPARPDQEMEGARRQCEADLVQDLRPRAVAQQHLVEDDQAAISLPESKERGRMAQAHSASKATLGEDMSPGEREIRGIRPEVTGRAATGCAGGSARFGRKSRCAAPSRPSTGAAGLPARPTGAWRPKPGRRWSTARSRRSRSLCPRARAMGYW